MKKCHCLMCDGSFHVEDTAKRRNYCPACKPKRLLETGLIGREALKARRKAAFPSSTRVFDEINALAYLSRAETAAVLGVTAETIRRDELSIIEKIRKHCGELAKECGYKFIDPNSLRLPK